MFTLQQGQIQRLNDLGMPEEAVMHMQDVFANCNQRLQHNGPVTFTGDVVMPNARIATWGKAIFNWQYDGTIPPSQGGSMAYVWVRRTDEDGNTPDYDNEVKVYLPVGAGSDPNVVADNVIFYYKTRTGIFLAPGYDDGAIGDIKSNISQSTLQGWGLMDGTANAITAGGSGVTATDRFMRQYDVVGNIGTTGGSSSSSIPDHSAADLNAALDDHSAAATTSAGAHDHGGNTGSTAPDAHHHSLTTDSHGVDGDNSTPVDIVTGTCSSAAKEPGCSTDEDLAHTHTITNESAHTHNTPTLSHNFSSGLSHGGGSVDLIPPYVYVAMLERLNNSRNVVQKATA